MDLIDAIKAIDKPHEDDVLNRLYTTWGENLDPDHVLTEYPRPQFVRDSYINLNGYWDYSITKEKSSDDIPEISDGKILVPFSPEAILSGVEKQLKPDEILWYKHVLPTLPKTFDNSRYLLHFGAVDQFADIYLNGALVGSHSGGYLPFTLDITDHLDREKENTLIVKVRDTSDTSYHSRGKQTLKRGGMYYTAQSGIWQTVWLEEVPDIYVKGLKITPEADLKTVSITITTTGKTSVSVKIPGQELVKGSRIFRCTRETSRFP